MIKSIFALGLLVVAPMVTWAADFDCVMDPSRVVRVSAAAPGILSEINVERGQHVAAGDVIARLNAAVETATVDLLETRAASDVTVKALIGRQELVRAQFDRVKELAARGVATPEQVDAAKAELLSADTAILQAKLDRDLAAKELLRATAQLQLKVIRAPVDGLVLSRTRDLGEYVAADREIITIVSLDPLFVEAFLPVALFPQVSVGDGVSITPAAPFTGVFDGTVRVVDQVFDAASGTFGIRVELPNPQGVLPAGHRCLVTLASGEQ